MIRAMSLACLKRFHRCFIQLSLRRVSSDVAKICRIGKSGFSRRATNLTSNMTLSFSKMSRHDRQVVVSKQVSTMLIHTIFGPVKLMDRNM